MKRFLIILFLVFIWPVLFLAQEDKSFYFESFKADIAIDENSAMTVSEELNINFTGSYSYFTRSIPYQGDIEIENIKVYDIDNNEELVDEDMEITDDGYAKHITVNFSAQDEIRKWLVIYRVKNAVNFFQDYDELYWNVIPDDRSVVIKYVEANVSLPIAVDDVANWQQTVYSGLYGSTESYNYNYLFYQDGQSVKFWAENIEPYYNFTIVAGWPKNIVSMPAKFLIESDPDKAKVFINNLEAAKTTPGEFWIGDQELIHPGENEIVVKKWGYKDFKQIIQGDAEKSAVLSVELDMYWWYGVLVICLIVLLILYIASPIFFGVWLFYRWRKLGSDPKGKGTIIPQYDSFNNDPPGIVGTLFDEKADLKDITSSIIDLAVRGYIKIIETSQKVYSLKILKDYNKDDKLFEYEKLIIQGLLGSKSIGDEIKLSSLSQKLYLKIPGIRDAMYMELLNKKYFSRCPQKVRKKYYTGATVLLMLGLIGSFIYFAGIPLIGYAILLFIFAGRMPQKTIQGVEAWQWAQGFKMFLYHAERYRIEKMTPEYFEKCLPYAMVFGVEKQWAKNFEDIYNQSPSWYQGSSVDGMIGVIHLTNSLSNNFTSKLTTTLSSRPSSNSGGSSGFSGGGFSGGGGGGGGFSAG